MPIQFRCVSCQQLLGIARRKAGKLVDCPTCGSKTLVPAEAVQGTSVVPPLPPVRRQPAGAKVKPISIFDRVDVEKLLQPPMLPELVKESETATALAEPPRRELRIPDPLTEALQDEAGDEPKPIQLMVQEEPELEEEPFAAMAQVPTLSPVRKPVSNVQLALGALAAAALAIGAFFAGHWVGCHYPLF